LTGTLGVQVVVSTPGPLGAVPIIGDQMLESCERAGAVEREALLRYRLVDNPTRSHARQVTGLGKGQATRLSQAELSIFLMIY